MMFINLYKSSKLTVGLGRGRPYTLVASLSLLVLSRSASLEDDLKEYFEKRFGIV